MDTLEASRTLKNWVERGVLMADASHGKQKTVYRKPSVAPPQDRLFSTTYLQFHYQERVIERAFGDAIFLK